MNQLYSVQDGLGAQGAVVTPTADDDRKSSIGLATQSRHLDRLFGILVELAAAKGGTFEFADAWDALDKAGLWADVVDPREHHLVLVEQAGIGLTLLTRAKLIERTVKLDLTRGSLRLHVQREIGSCTRFGRFLSRRGHAVRRLYLFLWSCVDYATRLKRRWMWLFGAGQFVAWGVGWWHSHAVPLEQTTAAVIVLAGAAMSIIVGWVVQKLTQ